MIGVRMTLATVAVLKAFKVEPGRIWYGRQLTAATGLPSGTLHPILARLEREGIVTSEWETVDEHAEGRRRRRYYRMVGS